MSSDRCIRAGVSGFSEVYLSSPKMVNSSSVWRQLSRSITPSLLHNGSGSIYRGPTMHQAPRRCPPPPRSFSCTLLTKAMLWGLRPAETGRGWWSFCCILQRRPNFKNLKDLPQTACLPFLLIFSYLHGWPFPVHLSFKASLQSHTISLLGSGSHQT